MRGKVTISRASDDKVRIYIEDEASGIQFCEAQMECDAFARAVTGLSSQDAELSVRGLVYVGKTRVTEPRRIACPLNTYEREKLKAWLEANAQEDGWILDTYLGSQNSVSRDNDATWLRYRVIKYVDASERAEKVARDVEGTR